ncbi:hypothetical protein M5K25_015940 [Dendrobium thyrsiflorum]|uniref:Uncharacterized protein n=1 Tax=Dendrobium thyrsiflorum TaxID=117978 RepID=A0ABD0URM7_DENTH
MYDFPSRAYRIKMMVRNKDKTMSGHRKDPAWKHMVKGGVTRMNEHLSRSHKNVEPYAKVPNIVREKIKTYIIRIERVLLDCNKPRTLFPSDLQKQNIYIHHNPSIKRTNQKSIIHLYIDEKYLRKRKITDIEKEEANWKALDFTGDEAGERAVHYDDNSNEDTLNDDSADGFYRLTPHGPRLTNGKCLDTQLLQETTFFTGIASKACLASKTIPFFQYPSTIELQQKKEEKQKKSEKELKKESEREICVFAHCYCALVIAVLTTLPSASLTKVRRGSPNITPKWKPNSPFTSIRTNQQKENRGPAIKSEQHPKSHTGNRTQQPRGKGMDSRGTGTDSQGGMNQPREEDLEREKGLSQKNPQISANKYIWNENLEDSERAEDTHTNLILSGQTDLEP